MTMSLLFLLVHPIASSLTNFPVVHTSYGSVRGYEYRAKNGFVAEIFKKIPYASPPIGSRRWKKPIPPEPWNYTIDGTFFGPGCAQYPPRYTTGVFEDCLTLNIYTSTACRESNASCSVVLFIHGGNALTGGTMGFTDEALVTNFASKGIIMVTVDYRLGAFGVMALGDENVLPANLAVHDVLESLRFIRKEIHNFGGDKDQITVMGHSTGATMIIALAFSPTINQPVEPPLFARIILMSSSAFLNPEEKQVARSHAIAAELGCTGTSREIIDCMHPFSADEILLAASRAGKRDVEATLQDITVAGELLPFRNVKELYENHKPTKLLLGSTLTEVGYGRFSGNYVTDILGVNNEKECLDKWKSDRETGKFDTDYNLLSQAYFLFTWQIANAQARAGGEVYLYQYDYPLNSVHGDDTFYILGSHERPLDANEEWLSRVYPVYFTNFIKGLPLAPDWTQLDPEIMNYYSVNKSFSDGVAPTMKQGYHRQISDYYLEMLEFDENLTKFKQMILSAPVEYKQYLMSPETFNIRDILTFSTLLIVILLIALKVYHSRSNANRSHEKRPILPNR